jgi:hypothetical protein
MNRSPALTVSYLKKLGLAVPQFSTFKTTSTTTKLWILPDGSPVALDCFHYQWLLQNREQVRQFGFDVESVKQEEQPLRLAALRYGFRRVNYEHPTGRLTVEANEHLWDDRATDAAFMIVLVNLDQIDHFTLSLLNNDEITFSESKPLFRYEDPVKLHHLPRLSDSPRGIALRRIAPKFMKIRRI